MTTETMTVHEGLCELKTLGKRIESKIEDIVPVGTKENKSEKVFHVTVADFSKSAKENMQSAEDLIKRFVAIKGAINQYNAETMITVDGQEYSMAQAIWMKDYGITHKEDLLRHLTTCYNKAKKDIERANGDKLTERAESAANANYGNKEKNDSKEYLDFIQSYKDRYQLVLIDPIGIEAKIKQLQDEISHFQTKIDSAMQVANATHTITIEY